jgi:hypothetical protein
VRALRFGGDNIGRGPGDGVPGARRRLTIHPDAEPQDARAPHLVQPAEARRPGVALPLRPGAAAGDVEQVGDQLQVESIGTEELRPERKNPRRAWFEEEEEGAGDTCVHPMARLARVKANRSGCTHVPLANYVPLARPRMEGTPTLLCERIVRTG